MKKSLKSVELFLATGLAVTLVACGDPSSTTDEATPEEGTPPTETVTPDDEGGEDGEEEEDDDDDEGGEGGEGGEGASTGNPEVDYMATLGLMKGHLIVAKELREAGEYEQAEPHIGHPVEELYGGLEGELSERNVPEFKSTLNQLNDLSKTAPEQPETEAAYQEAITSIDTAIVAIPESQRQSPEFVMAVINQMLATAAEEYQAAIAGDEVVELAEYQDSRGFVLYSEELYENIADQMQQNHPEDHQVITESMAELKAAWPSVIAPETPVKAPSEVQGLVSQIELYSSRIASSGQ